MNEIPVEELPVKVAAILHARGALVGGQFAYVNDASDIAYRQYMGVYLPSVLWFKGRIETVERIPSQYQDASELFEYVSVVQQARNFQSRNELTCRWVNAIHDQFVIRLLSMAYAGHLPRETVMHHRGLVDQAKFTVMRIWRLEIQS